MEKSEQEFFESCVELTKKLVAIPSMNSTEGEGKIAEFIEQELRSFDYFSRHPKEVFVQYMGDRYGRRNVFAFLEGENSNGNTVILHGHTDTVDIENYGLLKPFAFDCDRLLEEMKKCSYDDEVDGDLQSGGYMVGRGVCDMKCGIALCLCLMKFFSEHRSLLPGNLLFMANPGEELQHNGIIACVSELERLKREKGLTYQAAINTDCSNPHYAGDANRYLYYGTVGKLLPCFLILGKETHIGQCYAGIDASQIAAKLIGRLHLNMDYADEYHGEASMPPSVIRYEDNKTHYSVNTAAWAYVYFNFLLLRRSASEVMLQLKKEAEQTVCEVMEEIEQSYQRYCKKRGMKYKKLSYQMPVLFYEELYKEAEKKYGEGLDKLVGGWAAPCQEKGMDMRDSSRIIVQKLLDLCGYKENVIVLFLAPPFMPHSTLLDEEEQERRKADRLSAVLDSFNRREKQKICHIRFYPSLSDSSFLKIDDDGETISFVAQNMAGKEHLSSLPLEAIKRLNIPALNMGCYGKDPHRNTERLDVEYSFRILPKVMAAEILELMKA